MLKYIWATNPFGQIYLDAFDWLINSMTSPIIQATVFLMVGTIVASDLQQLKLGTSIADPDQRDSAVLHEYGELPTLDNGDSEGSGDEDSPDSRNGNSRESNSDNSQSVNGNSREIENGNSQQGSINGIQGSVPAPATVAADWSTDEQGREHASCPSGYAMSSVGINFWRSRKDSLHEGPICSLVEPCSGACYETSKSCEEEPGLPYSTRYTYVVNYTVEIKNNNYIAEQCRVEQVPEYKDFCSKQAAAAAGDASGLGALGLVGLLGLLGLEAIKACNFPGCYQGSGLTLENPITPVTTGTDCLATCQARGFTVGVVGLNEFFISPTDLACFCTTLADEDEFVPVDSSSCNTVCPADPTQSCGGLNIDAGNLVYYMLYSGC